MFARATQSRPFYDDFLERVNRRLRGELKNFAALYTVVTKKAATPLELQPMHTANHPHPVVFHRMRHLFGTACGICFRTVDYPKDVAKDTFHEWWNKEPLRGAKIRIGPKLEVFLDPNEKPPVSNNIPNNCALSLVKVVVKRIKPFDKYLQEGLIVNDSVAEKAKEELTLR